MAIKRSRDRMAAVVLLLSCFVGLAPRPVEARPRSLPSLEDAVADGDVDGDDVVPRAPWSGLARASPGRGAPRTAPGGSAWFSLVAFARPVETGQEVGGAVVVGVPLDRLARSKENVNANASPRFVPASTRDAEGGALVPSPRVARACVAAAWRASGLGTDDARVDGVVSRARWSALLPEARLRAVRGVDERASLEATAEANRIRGSAGADLALEARLTWRLDRLLFADEEPSFERLRLERHDARLRIAARTLEALFHWQRAAVELRSPGSTSSAPRNELELVIRMTEAEATLDVLTNGWFSQSVRDGVLVLPVPVAPPEPDARAKAPAGQGGT